jgi:integrase
VAQGGRTGVHRKMPVYYDKDKSRWRYSFNRVIGSERTRATKLLPKGWSRTQAERYDREETARLYAVASGVEKPEPSIGAAVALYIDHKVPKLRNGPKVVRDLAHLYEAIEGKPMSKLAEISHNYIKDHPELSDGTLHNRLAYLKAACRYAWKKHNLTEYDPTGAMEIPNPQNERHVDVQVGKVEKLLGSIEEDAARALFTLAFYTGSRWKAEIFPRQPEDVYRDGKKILLAVGKTKRGVPRLVPVPPAAQWALAYLPFTMNSKYYYDRFVAARDRNGLERFWVHDMRHVLGADVVRRTGSQRDAMEALHHASYASSLRYTRFATSRLEKVLFGVGQARKMHTSAPAKRRKKAA